MQEKSSNRNRPKNELLTILEQNWLHARHIENERLWFTNIYAIIVAGMIGILSINGFVNSSLMMTLLSIFLIYLSLLGIIATYKLSAEFHNHMNKIELIVERLKIKDYMGLPLDRAEGGRWKFLRFTIAIYLLYILVIIGCFIVLIN